MENNTNNYQIDNKFRKVFFRIVKISFGVLLSFFVVATLLLYIFKDEIGKTILLSVNKDISGLLTVQEFSVHPFAQFPNISLGLKNITLLEDRLKTQNDSTNSILNIRRVYIAFDIVELIKGNIDLSRVTIAEGAVNINTNTDSTINIVNTFNKTSEPPKQDILIEKTEEILEINVEEFILDDILLTFHNSIEQRHSSFKIKEFKTSLSRKTDESHISIDAILDLISFETDGKLVTGNNMLLVNADLHHNRISNFVTIMPSWFVFDRTQFNFSGTLNLEDDGYLNMEINGSDRKLNFLSLLLNDEALNLNTRQKEDANLYFEGTIEGKTISSFPNMIFKFGASNVNLQIPELDQSISELNFDGHFSSRGNTLSGAKFTINDFNAILPEGKTSGKLEFQNFNSPTLDLELLLETEVSWIDNVFQLNSFENLAGKLQLSADIEGSFSTEEQKFNFEKANSTLEFTEIAFNVPEIISVKNMDGIIEQTGKNIKLNTLSITTEDSDLLLSGNMENVTDLFFNNDSQLSGSITLKSDKFVFPELFAFDTSAARDFPYTIHELDVHASAISSTKKFQEFEDFPAIDFEIFHLNGNFEELPDVRISSSSVKIFEDIFGFNLTFDPLDINLSKGNMLLRGSYNGSPNYPYKIKSDAFLNDFYLLDFLQQFEMDLDTSSVFNGNLDGSFFTEVEFSKDSIMFDNFNFSKGNLAYNKTNRSDTITFKELELNLKEVNYDLEKNSNPLATLTTSGFIKADKFTTTDTKMQYIFADLSISNGAYRIVPSKNKPYNHGDDGFIELNPWDETPHYGIKYLIKDFPIENMLETFMEDSLLTGKIDLKLDVTMKGDGWAEILTELEGEISMIGQDLTLKGVDIDILLNKFERSQNFTLLDVSAVLLTGPIGLAVTKGSDVAMLVVTNSGESTKIPKLVSNWKIDEGILTMEDVAFSTQKNRVASKGSLDLSEQTADVTFAVLNEKGCSKISQTVSGQFSDPKFGDVKVLKTLLGPITNLWNSIVGSDCETFYTGSVEHPVSE